MSVEIEGFAEFFGWVGQLSGEDHHMVVSHTLASAASAEQGFERLGQHAGCATVFSYFDSGEERLGDLSLLSAWEGEVERLGVADQPEGVFEVAVDAFLLGFSGVEPFLDPGELVADAVLLVLQDVERDGVGEMSADEPAALGE